MNMQEQMPAPPRNRTKLNLFLDIGLVVFFAIEMEVHFTGLALHELLGLFFAAVAAIHVVLHWDWVVSITRTFFRKLIHESRINYVLNLALFLDVVVVMVSGVMISETLGLRWGLSNARLTDLQILHAYTSYLSLVLTALHVALHWKWIMTNVGKYLLRLPIPSRDGQPLPTRLNPTATTASTTLTQPVSKAVEAKP